MRGASFRAVTGVLPLAVILAATPVLQTTAEPATIAPEEEPYAPARILSDHIRDARAERWRVRRTVRRLHQLETSLERGSDAASGRHPSPQFLGHVVDESLIFVERGRTRRVARMDEVRARADDDEARVERLRARWESAGEEGDDYERERLAHALIDAHRAWSIDQAELAELEAALAWLEVVEEELVGLAGRHDRESVARLTLLVRNLRELEEGRVASLDRRIEEDRRRRRLGGEV